MDNKRKIVCYCIDDEPKALSIFIRLLKIVAPEWDLFTFTSQKQLINEAMSKPPDVLFSDIEMPDISGFKLIEQLKKISIYPITVFVTGFDHYAIKAIKESVLDYLVKPVDIDELEKTVKRIRERLNKPLMAEYIDKVSCLTPTEKEVLKLLARGLTSADAAKELNCSPNTINTHRNHILQKTESSSILETLNKLQD